MFVPDSIKLIPMTANAVPSHQRGRGACREIKD
jgi:3-deoxy-D-manno-octulosonate 8-phosphate phosphatase KdsC-like HAD superfamily phosphatase